MFTFTVKDYDMVGFDFYKGDILEFEDTPPSVGDLTLVRFHNDPVESEILVMIVGKSCMNGPIICYSYRMKSYPQALDVSVASLKKQLSFHGRMVRKLSGKEGGRKPCPTSKQE